MEEDLEEIEEETGRTPDALLRKPELQPHNEQFWACFQELSSTRRFMQAGPLLIEFQEIRAWLELHAVHPDAWGVYVTLIRRMDAAWIKAHGSKG